MSYLKNFIYLLIISTCAYAQDTHVYWDYNTETVSSEEFNDDHIYGFPFWYSSNGDACVDIPEENYYICLANIHENYCSEDSNIDIAFVKINYDGEEIDRNYICEFDQYISGSDDARAISYSNGNLYIVAYISIDGDYYPEIEGGVSDYNQYLMKFDLNGNMEWVRVFDYCGQDTSNPGYCNNIEFRDLEVDVDGNAIILGKAENVNHNNVGGDIYYISKYLSDGSIAWISMHHMSYEFLSNDCYPANYEGESKDIHIDEYNQLFFVGEGRCNNDIYPMLGKMELENGTVEWVKNLLEEGMFFTPDDLNTVSALPNGNIFLGGGMSGTPTIAIVDDMGNYVNYRFLSECYTEPTNVCNGQVYDSVVTPDGNISFVGTGNFTDESWLGAQGFLMTVDSNLDFISNSTYGTPLTSESDQIMDILYSSNGSFLLAGKHSPGGYQNGVLYNVSYKSGCSDIYSCNYDEYVDYDDGSCWQSQDSCTCDDPIGAGDDICGECNGNGYDTCDNDNDGTSNYDQWGYGAYNIELEDIPNDYGGGLYMTFNKSFYDQDDANRNEFYTIERYDDAGWVSLNSISAYNQETYTTEVSTQFDASETQFRVIATMDEGTFISTSNGSGTSVDNLTILGCMDIDACNYYSQATLDDGSCTYNDYGYECDGTLSEGFVELWNVPYSIETTTSLDLVSTGLSGTIPTDLGELVNLTYLNLGYNNLTGEIPSEIGNLINLDQINLYGNELTGSIPEEIGNLRNLISIDLYDNNLTGEIPPEITNVTTLIRIQLDNNQLTGSIPEDIGNLTNLDMLYLHNNQLSGTVPESICSIYSNLNALTLDNNKLCPVYPSCITLDIGNQDISECVIPGCTDENACNYWSLATIDDGTCFMGYDYCIDLDDDGFGDPEYIYTQCEYTDPNPLYVDNCDDICPDDNGVNVDSDGDGVCDDSDACPLDADDDSDSDGVCYNDEIFGCSDMSACNYDDTVTESDDSCTYAEANYDCDGNCVVEFDCSGECGGSAVGCAPGITSITDVPDDQGGRVYISFTSSLFDSDGVFRSEIYSVERSDNNQWVNVLSGSAYNDTDYTYEVTTLVDSTGTSDGTTSFRVIANMDEGVWISDEATGYSVDNIAPSTPGNFTSFYEDEVIVLNWDHVDDYDFDYYTVLRDGELVVETTESTYTHTPDTDQIELTYTLIANDINDNESTSTTTEVLQTNYSAGDINQDNNYNIFDIVLLIDVILDNYYGGQTPSTFVIWACDINDDGSIDVIDIINLVNQIMDINLN